MNTKRTAEQVLDEEFLLLRSKILEVAAGLDRIERATLPAADEARLSKLFAAVETLLRPGTQRAEQVQLLFSRAYENHWRTDMEL
ncbi:hypothetical protein [Aeoliella mucimassa]|uniref:Uncharacterized protein n=1 Tax=Aeoliella mucimassa TaxID=2527972 RepID=A0A518ANW0_9BACT|nr:hypothetical protein [Aeoliella mucimassa]QDU56409.1 hypothetical protein Pan181_26180 [Aeoliella mucimassa]